MAIDGQPVTLETLPTVMKTTRPGQEVTLSLLRAGKPITVAFELLAITDWAERLEAERARQKRE